MKTDLDVSLIIQKLGGPSAAARFFECKPSAVSQWVSENKIPNARLLHLKAARPDLFGPKVEERRARDQRMGERRALDLFVPPVPEEVKKPT